jgi:hypothetical protein
MEDLKIKTEVITSHEVEYERYKIKISRKDDRIINIHVIDIVEKNRYYLPIGLIESINEVIKLTEKK